MSESLEAMWKVTANDKDVPFSDLPRGVQASVVFMVAFGLLFTIFAVVGMSWGTAWMLTHFPVL